MVSLGSKTVIERRTVRIPATGITDGKGEAKTTKQRQITLAHVW